MSEHRIQSEIRNALAGECILFRVNSGRAWTGNDIHKLPDGSILIRDPRPFDSGVPTGFSDTVGVVTRTITQDMVGQTIGQALFGEIKTATGRVTPEQEKFIAAMKRAGAAADVWRSPEDALATVRAAKGCKTAVAPSSRASKPKRSSQ
jgi:hypothetical protein